MSAARHPLLRSVNLETLVGFDAVARLGGVTLAADALCLSQSAVSKQLKALEEALGVALFERGARGVSLTPAGAALHTRLAGALAELEQALAQTAVQARRALAITCPPALASLWLLPRLAQWPDQATCPELRLDASAGNLSLLQSGMDLAIRLGPARGVGVPGQGGDGECWMTERLQLVAAPEVAARIQSPAHWGEVTRLDFEHPVAHPLGMAWSAWADLVPGHPQVRTMRFSQYEQVVQAAQQGLGVAIGRRPLVDAALASGSLVVVCPAWQREGGAYRLLMAPGEVRAPVQAFVYWLRQQVAAS
ncbi:MAG: hypothetical protein RI907_1503 [Pseudomonadota bacterium]|jgi:DNA-binding transcriptional LysR family regulator